MLSITEAGRSKEGVLWEAGERDVRWFILFLLSGPGPLSRGEFLGILRDYVSIARPEQTLDALIRQGYIEEI